MAWFSRSRPVQIRWHESWDADTRRVIVHVPFAPATPAMSDTADELSQSIMQAVHAVQASEVGSSIPDGVSEATVAIVVEPATRVLGELELHTVEILRESLGSSIPIEVADVAAPAVEVDDEDEDPAVEAPTFSWDDTAKTLSIRVELPPLDTEPRAARVLKAAFNSGLAALATDDAQALIPEDVRGSEEYELHLALQPGTPTSGKVAATEATLRNALQKTKVTLSVEFAST